jgi:hypothetical protein
VGAFCAYAIDSSGVEASNSNMVQEKRINTEVELSDFMMFGKPTYALTRKREIIF